MEMIRKSIEPEALDAFEKDDQNKEARNRHERRADEARRQKTLDALIEKLTVKE